MKAVHLNRKINNYELFPKCGDAKIIMHQNMASHYRRVYNVKPRVDSGLKPSQKKPRKVLCKGFGWNKSYSAPLPSTQNLRLSLSSTNCSDLKAFSSRDFQKYHPQILKVNRMSTTSYQSSWVIGNDCNEYQIENQRKSQNQSSLSSKYQTSSRSSKQSTNPEISIPELTWTRSEDSITNPCKEISSDAASAEEEVAAWSGCDSRDPSSYSEPIEGYKSLDDFMYAKFVREITEEVLRKGDYSNKALKGIFQKHIDANKMCLSLRRMQEEVGKLKVELGFRDENRSQISLWDGPIANEKVESQSPSDDELWEALSHLNLSPSFRADIAYSLGLKTSTPYSSMSSFRERSIENCSSGKSNRANDVRASCSKSLEFIFDGRQRLEMLPDSDDESICYESSRPNTPLRLLW